MDDRFLFELQEPPRPAFAAALYRQIDRPAPAAPRRLALTASLAGLILCLALLLSPAARAAAQSLVFRLGRLFVTNQPTYAEQYERKANPGTSPASGAPAGAAQTPRVAATASPQALEWQAPPLLSLAEASALAGFPAAEIGALPSGMSPLARFVEGPDDSHPYTRITTTYGSAGLSLALTQTAYRPGAGAETLPAGQATLTPLTIHGAEALWIEGLRLSTYVDENNQVAPAVANLLVWEKDGCEYRLQSTPGLPQAAMIALAESLQP